MIKKNLILFVLLLIFSSEKFLASEIKIIVSIDDVIITNHDITKEMNYLEILNSNLSSLKNQQKFNLAKNSLVNEIIKKKELEKFSSFKVDNQLIENYFKDLYSKLGFSNSISYEKKLKEKTSYNLKEIKKKIETELLWNQLIYSKYIDKVKINRDQIVSKVNLMIDADEKEFLLSEIIFTKKKNVSIQNLFKEIKESINEIGFNNTANIYSNSESAKFGGQIGWISEHRLSKKIKDEINQFNKGEVTNFIKLGNNYLILKIEDIKFFKKNINKEDEINAQINLEINDQLSKFSKIYFQKIKLNFAINEK